MGDVNVDDHRNYHIFCEVYIVCNDHVLLFKRSDRSKWFPGYWVGPGGHIEDREDILTAVIRETKEETDVTIQPKETKLKVVGLHYYTDKKELCVEYLFLAKIKNQQKIKSAMQEGEAKWVAIDDALTMDKVLPPAKYYFDHILKDQPGVMFNNSLWKEGKLEKMLSQLTDANR